MGLVRMIEGATVTLSSVEVIARVQFVQDLPRLSESHRRVCCLGKGADMVWIVETCSLFMPVMVTTSATVKFSETSRVSMHREGSELADKCVRI